MTDDAVTLHHVRYSWPGGPPVINIENLTVKKGSSLFIHGPSGSGKSTLLGLISGVLKADTGDVIVLGNNLSQMPSHKRDLFRGMHIGYIFQMFNLIPYLTVIENILLPCRLHPARCKGNPAKSARSEAERLMENLGISSVRNKTASQISTGQAQRAAAARALLGRPEIIIADEPTSALDTDHREAFMSILRSICRESGSTLIFVSHDLSLASDFGSSFSLARRDTTEVQA